MIAGTAIISANATCMLGTAGERVVEHVALCSAFSPTKLATESLKPHSGRKRGGAVG
jgi:hypothetical protein